MEKIAQLSCGEGSSLAVTFVNTLRQISLERTEEIAVLRAERDSYRELAQAAINELAALNTRLDRERASRLWLLNQYRALQSGQAITDARLHAIDADILPEAAAA